MIDKIRYYIFAIKWVWANRDWYPTRQKYKAFSKALEREVKRYAKL